MKSGRPSTMGWLALGAAILALPLGHAACVESSGRTYGAASTSASMGSNSTGAGQTGFDKRALLASLGAEITEHHEQFATRAEVLAQVTATLAADPTPANLTKAQETFRSATLTWQRIELMLVGPASMTSLPGGKELRDGIYAWPSVNRCAVDQELAKDDHAKPEALATKLINVRGLGALERLLFHAGDDNACAAPNALNTTGAWTAIQAELPQRRARYAASAARLVADAAKQLHEAWSAEKGNFLGELASPGPTFGGDPAKALDAVAYALLYLDTRTKDLKLAVPAGLAGCTKATCPEALELGEAKLSKAAVRENLVGFQRIYHGGAPFDSDALGFDDWLEALGATELRSELAASIAAALAAVDAIEEDDLALTLANEPKRVEDVHLAIRNVVDLYKAQLVTVLDLHPPSDAPTDND
ncbi:MAG: imelysin family protein [Deltaproteobacteria bacterium]|nr:imelysin family protein [Deltaproteobacteria bacterium]